MAKRSLLESSASHDALTGLANRQAFEPRLARLFESLPRARPAAVALRVAEQVRTTVVGLRLPWQNTVLRVGASVGVAPLTEETSQAAHWVAAADQACYGAKAAGRNRIQAASHWLRRVDSATIPATR